eukprot:Phypoly_transcript_10424.p1 GENE.Phypoly_transcript_10424~~Phypoly_transcript_10424.p1  ORF type:complete len:433 (+),score=73.40 Phypoly_transcript_10424:114-1301(+)
MTHHSSSFVRLSTRSPKDAGLFDDGQFKAMVQKELIQIMEQHGKKSTEIPDPNEKLMAVFSISSKQLEVKNGEQAMGLLLESERIYTDLRHALEKDVDWDMKFIVREFVSLDVSYEFRGFACKNTLTAISQYNNLCYYPHFQDKEQAIVDKIVEFYKTICADIKYIAYVIDFVIIGDVVKVIEINPFGPMTGASLFNWDYNRYTVQGGMDLFSDSFGKSESKNYLSTENNTNNSQTSHNSSNTSNENNVNNVNNVGSKSDDVANNVVFNSNSNNNSNDNSNNNPNNNSLNNNSNENSDPKVSGNNVNMQENFPEDREGRDPTNNCYKDYLSTYTFPNNNWRTVLRVNKRAPSFVTEDYVNAMFSGVFGEDKENVGNVRNDTPPATKQKRNSCILL